MDLSYKSRTAGKKSESSKIRRNGGVPGVIYARGKEAEHVSLDKSVFAGLLRQVQPGRLSTTIFALHGDKGKARRAILKEIQYHPTTYEVIHLDFEELFENHKINIKVPIECIGMAECPGVKLGGVLRQVIRSVPVNCLPADIPEVFQLDVTTMNMRDSRRLKDLKIPETLRPLVDLNEVAAAIVKR
jgi:large subunit ribosomal protein L25